MTLFAELAQNFALIFMSGWGLAFILAIILGRFGKIRRFMFSVSLAPVFANIALLLITMRVQNISLLLLSLMALYLSMIGLAERYETKKAVSKLTLQGVLVMILFLLIDRVLDRYFKELLTFNFVAYLWELLGLFAAVLMGSMVAIRSRYVLKNRPVQLDNLPTVSLCIPARNETHALTESLDLSTDAAYEKLEIVVLDDCSQDKTPQIIRSFANKGVRFLKGSEPPSGWLGKTYAYEQLNNSSNGQILVFSGVDVFFKTEAINRLVEYFETNNLDMMSVVPERVHPDLATNLIQSARHFFLLSLPRPRSAISSCWMIRAKKLEELNGFKDVKSEIDPERSLALRIDRSKYQMVIASDELVTTRKRLESQIQTGLRTLYPMSGSNIFGLTWTVLGILLITSPYLALGASIAGIRDFGYINMITILMLTFSYALAQLRTQPKTWLLCTVLTPLALASQIYLLIASAFKYEFGIINWKRRDICIIVMDQKNYGPLKSFDS